MSDNDKPMTPTFREGWEAQATARDCPYTKGSKRDEWLNGFWARIEHEVDQICSVLEANELKGD